MAQRKPATDGKTQSERFIEAARALGADEHADAFRRALRTIATAPVKKAKAPKKPKR